MLDEFSSHLTRIYDSMDSELLLLVNSRTGHLRVQEWRVWHVIRLGFSTLFRPPAKRTINSATEIKC
jgi:hypothetical protein